MLGLSGLSQGISLQPCVLYDYLLFNPISTRVVGLFQFVDYLQLVTVFWPVAGGCSHSKPKSSRVEKKRDAGRMPQADVSLQNQLVSQRYIDWKPLFHAYQPHKAPHIPVISPPSILTSKLCNGMDKSSQELALLGI